MPKYTYYQLQTIYLSYFNRFKNLSSTRIRNTQTVKLQVIYLSRSPWSPSSLTGNLFCVFLYPPMLAQFNYEDL